MAIDVRVSVLNPSGSVYLQRDVYASDFKSGHVRYENTPGGCNSGALGLGLYYEDFFTKGYYSQFNIVEISTGDDTLAQAFTTNLATASDALTGWTLGGLSAGAGGPGGANDFELVGTGAGSGNQYAEGPLQNVTAGTTYVFGMWVDASVITSGSVALAIWNAGFTATLQTLFIPAGAAKRYVTLSWLCPGGTTQVRLFCGSNFATIANGAKLKFSQPMFEASSAASALYVPSGTSRLYCGSTLAYDPAQGEDTQQVYLTDANLGGAIGLTMGIPVTAVGTDAASGKPYLTVGAPLTMPGNPGTIGAYAVGSTLGRRNYAGLIRLVERPNDKLPQGGVTLGPLSSAFDEVQDGYSIGAGGAYDASTVVSQLLTKNASRWPQITVNAANFTTLTGSTFSGSRQTGSIAQAITDVVNAISSGDSWFVRVGHDRTPRMIRLYTSGSNTYTYPITLHQGTTAFEPTGVIWSDNDCSQFYNAIQVIGNTNPVTNIAYSAIVVDGYLAAASALTAGTTAGAGTALPVTAGTGLSFQVGASIVVGAGTGNVETCTVSGVAANTVTVSATAHNHGSTETVTMVGNGSIGTLGRQIDGAPVTVTALNSVAACAAYGRALLNQYSIGRARGVFRVYTRNDVTFDALPQGLKNGDVIRGVNCVTVDGFSGGAPAVFGLVSSVVTEISAEGDRWQDVAFAPIEADWVTFLRQQDNANATALHANTPAGAGAGQYAVSSAAYPPTFTGSSLVLTTPAFRAMYAYPAVVSIAANTVTLAASSTSWIWVSSAGTYTVQTGAAPTNRAGELLYGFASTNATGITGFTQLTAVSQVDWPVSDAFVNQGNIIPAAGVNILPSYSSTSTSLTLSVGSYTFYRSNSTATGLTWVTPSASSGLLSGLSPSTTYHFSIWYSIALNQVFFHNYGTSALTPQQKADAYQDGLIPIYVDFPATTPASGTGSGGGGGAGGGGFQCPATHQQIETCERGFIRADELRAGDHLRDPFDGWNAIEKLATLPTVVYRITTDEESVDVNETHAVLDVFGSWRVVTQLAAGARLAPLPGSEPPTVRAIERLGEGEYVAIQCARHRYVLGRTIGHNITF